MLAATVLLFSTVPAASPIAPVPVECVATRVQTPVDPGLELSIFANIDLRTVGSGLTAFDLVERANPCLPGFDRDLWARLGEPVRLMEAHGFPPLPEHLEILPYSARWLMLRQLVVTYRGPQEPERLRELIENQPEFTGSSIVEPPSYNATTPTDPLVAVAPPGTDLVKGRQQWLVDAMNLPDAWDYGDGWTSVAVLDSGVERGVSNQYPAGFLYHPEIDANVLRLNSWLLGGRSSAINSFSIAEPAFQEQNNLGGHGTHVAGLVAAQANNTRGGVGACPGCGLAILNITTFLRPESPGFLPSIRTGASVVNRSGSRPDDAPRCVDVRELDDELIPIEDYPWSSDAQECSAARILYERQTALFVSSGNDRRAIGWPARAPYAIAVGGTDISSSR